MSHQTRAQEPAGRTPLLLIGLAWTGAAVTVVAAVANTLWLSDGTANGGTFFTVLYIVLVVGLGVIGALIASVRPWNVIGWLLLLAGVLFAVSVVGSGYAQQSVNLAGGTWPLTVAGAWLASWTFVPAVGAVAIFLPLVFPTGRLPSRRWALVLIPAALGLLGGIAPAAFAPGPLSEVVAINNPLGITSAGPALETIGTISAMLAPAVFILVVISLVLRYRRGGAVERNQIKWFVYPAAISAIGLGIGLPDVGLISEIGWTGGLTAMALLPFAIGAAVLRYRLFDIDLIINRTLVYGALSVVLAVVYVASVLLLEQLLAPFAPGNPLAIAASTLGVVALFQPLRRRIQRAVDHRFYRSRYDAARVVNAFSGRLRDQVELGHLTDELRGSIAEALQPSSVSVWLRQPSVDR